MLSSISSTLPRRILSSSALQRRAIRATSTAAKVRNLTTVATTGQRLASRNTAERVKYFLGGTVVGITVLQAVYGSSSDYYEYRFITDKDPDDLASFYGGEEFMELFCVFPFVGTIMMRNCEFDEEGTAHAQGVPGDLQASMVFSSEDDDETGQTLWFNKRERFKNVFMGMKTWDTVTNFGFQRLPDGRIECYHHGEYFMGNSPPISLAIKLIFQVHARWVAWATEHHINHHAFTSETEEEEEIEESSRSNMLLHMIEHHAWNDFKAMVFGVKEPSSHHHRHHDHDEHAEHEEETQVSFLVTDREEQGDDATRTIAVKRRNSLNRIAMDIQMDKKMPQSEVENDDETLGLYRRLSNSAMHRHQSLRASKHLSRKKSSA